MDDQFAKRLPWHMRPFVIKAALTGLAALLLVQLFLDPLGIADNVLAAQRLRRDLPAARSLWEAQHINDYSIDVHGYVPLACAYDAKLTVRHGVLADALTRTNQHARTAPFIVSNQDQSDDGPCAYADVTISKMLDQADKSLSQLDLQTSELKISFDAQYGYVRHFEYNYGYGHGILSSGLGECCTHFEFSNFQPLATSLTIQGQDD